MKTPSTSEGACFEPPPLNAGGATPTPHTPQYWTLEEIAAAHDFPLNNVQAYWPAIAASMTARGLASPRSFVGAIGTIAKETGTFAPVKEAYWLSEEWRRANLRYYPYYGRGFIQTTWESNYARVERLTGLPVVANPDMLLQPVPAAEALAIYWADHSLHTISEREDWPSVRRVVLGGGDPEGVARIQRVAAFLLPRTRLS